MTFSKNHTSHKSPWRKLRSRICQSVWKEFHNLIYIHLISIFWTNLPHIIVVLTCDFSFCPVFCTNFIVVFASELTFDLTNWFHKDMVSGLCTLSPFTNPFFLPSDVWGNLDEPQLSFELPCIFPLDLVCLLSPPPCASNFIMGRTTSPRCKHVPCLALCMGFTKSWST